MQITELVDLINKSESIEKFAEDNLLKIASQEDKHILNYSEQILWTPKSWISHYCRGITLRGTPGNYRIIAKSFDRFYHLNENPEYLTEKFDTSKPFEVQFKYDGSIILSYMHDHVHQIQTRWSFCSTPVSTSYPGTFKDLFIESKKDMIRLDEWETEIYELCSPHNQVVDFYSDTFSITLGVVRTDGTERKDVFNGEKYHAENIEEVLELLKTLKPTQEWFVLAQWNEEKQKYIRIKCKTETWTELSHFSSGLVSKEGLWNVVFSEEVGEVSAIFPHLTQVLDELSAKYHRVMKEAEEMYEKHKNIENQKEFAMALKDHDFAPMMFWMRKWVPIRESVQQFLNR